MKKDFSWTMSILTLIFAIFLAGCIVALAWHQWDDCLEENSFFTCARMLNK